MNPVLRPLRAGVLLWPLCVGLAGCVDGAVEPPDARVAPEADFRPYDRDPPRADLALRRDAMADPAPDARVDGDLDATLDPRDAAPESPDAAPDSAPSDSAPPDVAPPCPEPPGARCNPIVVDDFPAVLEGDTRDAPAAAIDAYACAPDTDEGGGEVWYALDIDAAGLLSIRVDDRPGDAVDIDLHLLDAPEPAACLDRDNTSLSRMVEPGRLWLVADTWVNGAGAALAGPYVIDVDLRPIGMGDCAFDPQPLRMVWRACDPSLPCRMVDGEAFLDTPAMGPVVKEAHLVTVADDFGGGWPSAARDGIEAHYALSEAATGYAMDRREPWAPEGEGGSEWGQAAFFRPLPVVDEAWYVNMYWRDRPPPGTRMLVHNPANGRTVVAAGGYETGPGSNTAVGGASEEIHHHLGTTHRDALLIGFALDPDLPLGPIDCAP